MSSQSDQMEMAAPDRGDYGFARVRDVAFDAIQILWRRRQAEGMKQRDIVNAVGHHASTVSRNLRAPGNWTLRTVGEFVEALNGEIEITVHAMEDVPTQRTNYSAYSGYEARAERTMRASQIAGNQIIDPRPRASATESMAQIAI